MYMKDYVEGLDKLLATMGRGVLENAGSVSSQQAKGKALKEYRKYEVHTLSAVEKDYLDTINSLEEKVKKRK